jgi:hypothetical protein
MIETGQTCRQIELARVIRSKNAGPFELTFDIMFLDAETYERAKRSGVIDAELFAWLYAVPLSSVPVSGRPTLAVKLRGSRPRYGATSPSCPLPRGI